VQGRDEVAQLQADFNAMADALQAARREIESERDAIARLLESRRTLFASVSHDLRTPVATVRGYLDSLRENDDLSPDIVADLDVMEGEVLRLQRLIDDVFALARLDVDHLRFDLEPVDVDTVLARCVRAGHAYAWRSARVEIVHQRADRPLPPVRADEMRLEQVIHNLLRNAVRHTLPGGLVAVGATLESPWVRVDVSDTGSGIGPDALPHIWERYYQASDVTPDSAGIGLALVEEMVEAMGGMVSAESTPGAGSVFMVRLPHCAVP
jgi:signal transduction histidine kinase